MRLTDDDLRIIGDALHRYSNLRKTKYSSARAVELGLGFMQQLYEREYLECALMELAGPGYHNAGEGVEQTQAEITEQNARVRVALDHLRGKGG